MKLSAKITRIKKYMYLEELINRATEAAIEEMAPLILKDFERTTRKWKQHAQFSLRRNRTARSGTVSFSVTTRDAVWKWVNYGTKRKDIFPYRAKVLRFLTSPPARSITTPNALRMGTRISATQPFGSRYEKGVIYRASVRDNAIEARNFDTMFRKKWEKRISPIWRRHFTSLRGTL